jgi:hypothetical protein
MITVTALLPPHYAESTITISRDDAYHRYANALGCSVEVLTDTDKCDALVEAVIAMCAQRIEGADDAA